MSCRAFHSASQRSTHGDPIGRFFAHAARRPDHPAVDLGDAIVTYAELEAMARRLAARFAAGERILIALPPGAPAYAAMIASLLSGASYVPINVATPVKKLAGLLRLIEPDVIVAETAWLDLLPDSASAARRVDSARITGGESLQGPGRRSETAYIILTSGSTGAPKGVVVSMAALSHYVDWLANCGMFGPDDRVSQFPSISFDLSVLDIYGALNAGATLAPAIAKGDRLFPGDFARRARLTVWVSVPSAIGLVMTGRQATADMLGTIRLFVFCGEALRRTHLTAIFEACPSALVTNLYGPTEATVSVTALSIGSDGVDEACADSMALGAPIPGMGLHLVGGAHPGEGEIVITGPQLASEYWRDSQRTGVAFRPVTINGQSVRGYHTGDWAERRGEQLFFRTRIDRQLKINGYRIETDEVVARLGDCGWPVACVLKHGETLTAVVEAVEGRTPDAAALRSRLHTELDAHAVPAYIHFIDRMPRNSNDKLDEAAVRTWLDERTAG